MSNPWIRIVWLCCLLLAGTLGWAGSAGAATRRGRGNECARVVARRSGGARVRRLHDAAPILRDVGGTLSWKRVRGFRSYELATVPARTSIVGTSCRVVTGTRFTPRPEPGLIITYHLRVNFPQSTWSRDVSIRWPPAGTTADTHPDLHVAVNNAFGADADSLFRGIGVSWERLDIGTGAGMSYIRAAVSDGMHVLPEFTAGEGGSLEGLTPADVASDIASLVPQLTRLGITTLEFGNEVYRFMNARSYAALYDAAHRAAAGRIKLLAPATTDWYEHARGGKGSWFSDLAAALPGGPGEVDGLTLHPYGPMTSRCGDGYGWPMIAPLHAESVRAGFSPSLPWYITEVGQEVWGSPLECQPPVSEAVQAVDVTTYLNDVVTKYPWIVFLSFYTSRDDPTSGFGLLNLDNTPRPAFLALAQWMAAHAAQVGG